ncbi:hypothetical protein [Enterobacter asburiae]|uniref:hypothetical protein n=1 Tax=Enterobacter asburiae TaxID=61645 RepID=UPI00192B5B60|nr:hypothetical protein [Enterobacter asburiae]MBL5911230.1 hypothetical protein [Enterobacter asburiae]
MDRTAFLHVDFQQPKELEFNRRKLRLVFVKIGQAYMEDARRLVMKTGRSGPGDYPSHRTGKLARSIGYWVPHATSRRPGLMVKIAPNQRNGQGNTRFGKDEAYYPAFLYFGVRRGAKRTKSHKKGASGGSGWRIAPRANYMTETLEKRRAWTQSVLSDGLSKSLRPEKRKK